MGAVIISVIYVKPKIRQMLEVAVQSMLPGFGKGREVRVALRSKNGRLRNATSERMSWE
jgi:hypothetical protein